METILSFAKPNLIKPGSEELHGFNVGRLSSELGVGVLKRFRELHWNILNTVKLNDKGSDLYHLYTAYLFKKYTV